MILSQEIHIDKYDFPLFRSGVFYHCLTRFPRLGHSKIFMILQQTAYLAAFASAQIKLAVTITCDNSYQLYLPNNRTESGHEMV
jgi:hypothetical protein